MTQTAEEEVAKDFICFAAVMLLLLYVMQPLERNLNLVCRPWKLLIMW